jgi:hypothetical protein
VAHSSGFPFPERGEDKRIGMHLVGDKASTIRPELEKEIETDDQE